MAEVKKPFKDFYQYTKKQFENIPLQAGNFYLVREVELDESGNEKEDENGNKISTGNAEIWFGTRKYANVGVDKDTFNDFEITITNSLTEINEKINKENIYCGEF